MKRDELEEILDWLNDNGHVFKTVDDHHFKGITNNIYMIDNGVMTADQKMVLSVIKNNRTEEGANIATDFDHLGSKFIFTTTIFVYTNINLWTIFSDGTQTSRDSELVV